MSDAPTRSLRSLPRWVAPAAVWAALAALVAYSAQERWALLTSSPFPLGVDGFYYPIQLRSLLETGGLEYPAAPLAFWLMAPLAAATDPITGAKLGAAIFGALIALPAYAVGARLGASRGAGLIAAVLATRSAGSAYLTTEFVKNGIGLALALAALWLVLRAAEHPGRGRIATAGAALVAAWLTHKMALPLVAVVGAPAVVAAAAGRGALRGRRLFYAIVGIAGAALLVALLGLLAPKRLLSPADAALLEGVFTSDARWSAPVLAGARTLELGGEALAACWLSVLLLAALSRPGKRAIEWVTRAVLPREHALPADAPPRRPPPGDTAAGRAIALLAIAIGLPWLDVTDAQGLAFRLRIAAFVPLALVAAMLAGRLLAYVRSPDRELALAALALALVFYTPGDREEGRVAMHPALVSSVQALAAEPSRVPADAIIILPERHLVYMAAWYLHREVRTRPDRVPPERRWRLVPGNWLGLGSPLDAALLDARERPGLAPPVGLHPSHPNGMVLVPEATWQAIAARLPPGSRWAQWQTR